MRLRIATFTAVLAIAALIYAPQANAAGFRVGGTSIVDPDFGDKAHQFSIGWDSDTMFIEWLGLNSGNTFHVNGDFLFVDGFFGLIGKIPVAVGGKLKVTVRGDFLVKYGYWFEDAGPGHSIGIGGIVGPGIEFDFGSVALGFDVDIQFYWDMWYNVGREPDDAIIAVSYMASLHF